MKSFLPQLPIPFDTDWHHQFGRSLSVFPRSISFREEGSAQDYWPDLATFISDPGSTRLAYYPAAPSPFSVCVLYRKMDSQWETFKFCDDLLLQHCTGNTFEEVMEKTIVSGMRRSEG